MNLELLLKNNNANLFIYQEFFIIKSISYIELPSDFFLQLHPVNFYSSNYIILIFFFFFFF